MASTIKTVEAFFEKAVETYENQTMLIDKVDVFTPDSGSSQNAGNFIWRPVQQHAPTMQGWDLTGLEGDLIEEGYPAVLRDPYNDFVGQRADDMRDMQFFNRRAAQSGKQQATLLNQEIAKLIVNQGSLFYRSNEANGFKFLGEGQVTMNERQGAQTTRCYVVNDRDMFKFSGELSGRDTVKGRVEDSYAKGKIGKEVAEFDEVYTGSFLPNLVGGASPGTTTTAGVSFKPEPGVVDVNGVVTNTDYRRAVIPVVASGSYNIGDKIHFENGGTPVYAIGLSDKTITTTPMTFTIVSKPNATSIEIFPKPIALDDGTLTTVENAYSNVDTTIDSGAVVVRLNIGASERTNIFWDKDAVEVLGGELPAHLFSEFEGMKHVVHTMKNGLNMYMFYDASMVNMRLRYRLFSWWGLTMKDPSRAGCSTTFT